jgi:hypothetical protein
MAQLYTPGQRLEILNELGIQAIRGKVTGDEAASILTWRAMKEFSIEHKYDAASLRQRALKGDIKPGAGRKNRYPVGKVFELPISPARGRAKSTPEE